MGDNLIKYFLICIMVFCAFDLYQAIVNRLGVNSVPFFGLMFGTVCIGLGRFLTKAG